MADALRSSDWYRVAALKPRLRRHAQVRRHVYRGELWYVLQDPASQRSHRLSEEAYYLVALMDGAHTVQAIWQMALEKFGDAAPTQQELIRLFGELHAADILQCDLAPDALELQHRARRTRRSELMQRLLNPMAVRFSLFDPDRFLNHLLPVARVLFSPVGAVLWLLLISTALTVVVANWEQLAQDVSDRVLAPGNLVMLGLIYPIVKALHEFGHGMAVKRWGGEVHDMGIMFLVLMPMPYVDASSASGFRERYKRVLVGAAGMLVELSVASLATFLWVTLEPGVLRSAMYNVMLIAGVSTVLFNINPLLRFDGYYILADLIESPNLTLRSNRYVAYLAQKYLLGHRRAEPVALAPGEKTWFLLYSVAAFIYRLFIAAAIIIFIAGRFFTVGLLLAAWSAITMVFLPLGKAVWFVLQNPAIESTRRRAVGASVALAGSLLALVFLVPFPFMTRAEGVIWLPEQSQVRAGVDSFIQEVRARPGAHVSAGDVIIVADDPVLKSVLHKTRLQLAELQARYRAEQATDIVASQVTLEEIGATRQALARVEEKSALLLIRSHVDGVLILPRGDDLVGRYLQQGELLGYVVGEARPTIRTVVTQADVDLVRSHTESLSVRLASRVPEVYETRLLREVPAASSELPSAALTQQGGGKIANSPSESRADMAYAKLFQFEAELPAGLNSGHYGGRVYVRFNHGLAPLWQQWYRELKILFLRLLDA